MTIEDTSQVDIVSLHKATDTVVLTVSDHLQWGDREHLYKLQEKINTYLAYIESGEIYTGYPLALGKKLKIDIRMKYDPDQEAVDFLNQCADIVLSAGYQFGYEVFDPEQVDVEDGD